MSTYNYKLDEVSALLQKIGLDVHVQHSFEVSILMVDGSEKRHFEFQLFDLEWSMKEYVDHVLRFSKHDVCEDAKIETVAFTVLRMLGRWLLSQFSGTLPKSGRDLRPLRERLEN